MAEEDRGGQSAAQGGHIHRRRLPRNIRGADSGRLRSRMKGRMCAEEDTV